MMLNVTALVVFTINALLQAGKWNEADPAGALPVVLAAAGVLLTVAAGFFGWTLVQDHHVGVNLRPDQQLREPAGGEASPRG